LDEKDLFELTEGHLKLLEKALESELATLIINNLSLFIKDGKETLVCQHRIDFCPLWQKKLRPHSDFKTTSDQVNQIFGKSDFRQASLKASKPPQVDEADKENYAQVVTYLLHSSEEQEQSEMVT
jgi:hypothetical protein